jgi:hypothetical protein
MLARMRRIYVEVVMDGSRNSYAKSHTDPGDLTGGIVRCLQKSGLVLSEATDFVPGSTVAINTAIERKGAVTALIVTRGMRDVEIDERLDAAGNVVTPLVPQSVRDALQVALGAEAESIAVGRSPSPDWHWDPLLTKARAVAVRVGVQERIDPLREAVVGFCDSRQFLEAVLN